MGKKDNSESKKFELLKLELDEAEYKEVEKEKLLILDELDQTKKYLIKEVVEDGETFLKEIEKKEKRTFLDKIMDFIFK
jgi:formiminotetrahydrofolate cyclodeaminase